MAVWPHNTGTRRSKVIRIGRRTDVNIHEVARQRSRRGPTWAKIYRLIMTENEVRANVAPHTTEKYDLASNSASHASLDDDHCD